MNRFFRLLHREQEGVLSAALLLALASLGNAVLALLRDRLLASTFGASRELDMYFAAFRIPDLLFSVALLFVASTAFIPVYTKAKLRGKGEDLLHATFTMFTLVLIALIVVSYFLMPMLVRMSVPGFSARESGHVVTLSRFLLLSPLLLGFSNLISGVIQAERRFFIYALSPIFYNLGIIFGILVFAEEFGIYGVVWGVLIGALLHLLIQLPTLLRLGVLPRFTLKWDASVREVVTHSFPRTIALSFHQLTFLVIIAFGSTLSSGAIAVFNLAYNLHTFPIVVIGLSYSIAAFPFLSDLSAKNDRQAFFNEFGRALRHIMVWTFPATALFLVLRAHIVRVVLGAGVFSWIDTRLTAASLLLFSLSIVAGCIILLTIRAYYALGRTKEPVYFTVVGFITVITCMIIGNFLLSYESFAHIFASALRVTDLPSQRMLILPMAYSLGVLTNASLLLIYLSRHAARELVTLSFRKTLAETLSGAAIAGAGAFFTLQLLQYVVNPLTATGVFIQGVFAGFVGLSLAASLLLFLKNKEIEEILDTMHMRFWNVRPKHVDTEHI